MSFKTREEAINKLAEYASTGMVFRYTKSGRWNFATTGSGVYEDVWSSLDKNGCGEITPASYLIKVENVEIFTAIPIAC